VKIITKPLQLVEESMSRRFRTATPARAPPYARPLNTSKPGDRILKPPWSISRYEAEVPLELFAYATHDEPEGCVTSSIRSRQSWPNTCRTHRLRAWVRNL